MSNVDNVLQAFEDYAEAAAKLKEAEGEYTGYSPSYHLHSWYEARDKARADAEKSLKEYIWATVKEILGATP